MVNIFTALFFGALMLGCSSFPKFKKSNSSGYTLENISEKVFVVELNLTPGPSVEFRDRYAWRAAGEECQRRGFKFFDYARKNLATYLGFCHEKNERRSLAIVFDKKMLRADPPSFVVTDLLNKKQTSLKIGDKITSLDGIELASVAQIKHIIAKRKDSLEFRITLERGQRVIEVSEPVVIVKDGVNGPKDLSWLRRKVP